MIKISREYVGKRLDVFLSKYLESVGHIVLTRTVLKSNWSDLVTVNSKVQKPGYKLSEGDEIFVNEDRVKELEDSMSTDVRIEAEEGDLDIVFENTDFLVIKKEKGMVVHPGIGNSRNTLANKVRGYLESKGEYDRKVKRAGVVHRLDKGVSGLIVFAKSYKSQKFLQKQFEEHNVKKIYLAKVEYSELKPEIKEYFPSKERNLKGEIDTVIKNDFLLDNSWYEARGYIRRSPRNRVKMEFNIFKSGNAKNSLSYIKPVSNQDILVIIETGRMHQIRATLEYLGMTIVGDTLYGNGSQRSMPEKIELKSILLKFKDMEGKDLIIKDI